MLAIPPAHLILDRCQDIRRDAQLQRDASGIKALNAIIASVVCDYALLTWDGPYLTVASESQVGATHQVSAFGCSCPAFKPCWHQRLRDLIIGIMETEADSADDEALLDEAAALIEQLDTAAGDCDFEADCDEPAPREWRIGALFATKLDARAACWARL